MGLFSGGIGRVVAGVSTGGLSELLRSDGGIFKQGANLLTGGEPAAVAELKRSSDIERMAKDFEAKGKGEGESTAGKMARLQADKAQSAMSSGIQSARGMSSGLKQALATREGRKLKTDVALGASALESQERTEAAKNALNALLGLQSQEQAREQMIVGQDQAKRAARASLVNGLLQGASSAMTMGMMGK